MQADAASPWMTLVSPAGKIHLYAARIAAETAVPADLSLLSVDENARAETMHTAVRQHYVQTRIWLRTLLGQLLECSPAAVNLETDALGKPLLACGSLHINWSHSRDACVLAVSRTATLGVDIEFHRRRFSLDIAKRFFHPDEYAQLTQLSQGEAQSAFFRYWSRKEAHYKCVGGAFMGGSLSMDLRSAQVETVHLWDFQGPFPNEPHCLGLAARVA